MPPEPTGPARRSATARDHRTNRSARRGATAFEVLLIAIGMFVAVLTVLATTGTNLIELYNTMAEVVTETVSHVQPHLEAATAAVVELAQSLYGNFLANL